MKYYILLLSFITFNFTYSQKYFNEDDYNSYIDYTTNSINLTIEGNKIEGVFTEMEGKDYYKYLVVKGNNNIHSVIKKFSSDGFFGLDILKGNYDDVLKEFKKGRKYKKSEVIFSNLPSDGVYEGISLISETIKEMRVEAEIKREEEKKKEEEFKIKFAESNMEGVYKIKILKHRNLDYKNTETFGKIIITEVGITIETEIPSLDLLRSSYNVSSSKPLGRSFVCNINKGYGDFFSLTINEGKTVGGLTVMNGRNSVTTTFMIVE